MAPAAVAFQMPDLDLTVLGGSGRQTPRIHVVPGAAIGLDAPERLVGTVRPREFEGAVYGIGEFFLREAG